MIKKLLSILLISLVLLYIGGAVLAQDSTTPETGDDTIQQPAENTDPDQVGDTGDNLDSGDTGNTTAPAEGEVEEPVEEPETLTGFLDGLNLDEVTRLALERTLPDFEADLSLPVIKNVVNNYLAPVTDETGSENPDSDMTDNPDSEPGTGETEDTGDTGDGTDTGTDSETDPGTELDSGTEPAPEPETVSESIPIGAILTTLNNLRSSVAAGFDPEEVRTMVENMQTVENASQMTFQAALELRKMTREDVNGDYTADFTDEIQYILAEGGQLQVSELKQLAASYRKEAREQARKEKKGISESEDDEMSTSATAQTVKEQNNGKGLGKYKDKDKENNGNNGKGKGREK